MIKPTIGRVVWFQPSRSPDMPPLAQPFAALIAYVHSGTCINVAAFDQNGAHIAACSVKLLQEGEAPPETGYYAEWAPLQKGQAKLQEAEQPALQPSEYQQRAGAEAGREAA